MYLRRPLGRDAFRQTQPSQSPINKMEEEKKPKRPRISGAPVRSSAEGYQQRNFNTERTEGGYQPRTGQGYQQRPNYRQQSGYQPRYGQFNRPQYQQPYQQNNASSDSTSTSADSEQLNSSSASSQAQNQNPTEGGYQPRQNHEGGYQPRTQGYQPRTQGYQPRTQGYQPRQQGGYQPRTQGYQPRQQGGYQPRQQGGYQNQGYKPRQNQEGGYQPRQNQGYKPRQNQGYNKQGGYQNRQQGGYNRNFNNHQGGFQKQQKPGMKFIPRPKQIDYVLEDIDPTIPIRLNKYMANAGICSRREADEYITNGLVKVNGEVVTELGTKINRDDVVEYDGKVVTPERKCYVLLNKPKDCVTTSDDPNGRMTVLDLVKNACQERIYPVGRLDRNTTGVLLLTNDGELASKLTHPKFVKKKIYHVWTDKDIAEEDMQRIADGIELEDGEIHADAISYVNDIDRNQAGIEIHSGRNRIVRRIFEHLGYRVTKLDRVYFAGLTKKNLPRGRWRYLTQEEVNFLRMGSFE